MILGTLVVDNDIVKHYIGFYGKPISAVYRNNMYIYTFKNEKEQTKRKGQ